MVVNRSNNNGRYQQAHKHKHDHDFDSHNNDIHGNPHRSPDDDYDNTHEHNIRQCIMATLKHLTHRGQTCNTTNAAITVGNIACVDTHNDGHGADLGRTQTSF